jgi:hypothetical protein
VKKERIRMWILRDRWQGQEILDWVDIEGWVWLEVPDAEEKGVENVQSKNRTNTSKEAISFENELCELGTKQAYDRNSKRST